MITKTIARSLLPALLLALAACVVNTDDLKPKTDAQCQAADPNTKACGNRCVTVDDPALGCGNPSCTPCPAPPGAQEVYCDAMHSCAFRPVCSTGQVRCDGPFDVTCEDLAWDQYNCGACFHTCNLNGCQSGTCIPAMAIPPEPSGAVPLDLAAVPGGYVYVDDGFGGAPGNGRFVGPNTIGGLGYVDRVETDVDGNAFVSVATLGASVLYVPMGANTATGFFAPEGIVRSMAVSPWSLWLSTVLGTSPGQEPFKLLWVDRMDVTNWASYDPGLGPFAGVAYLAPEEKVVFGTEGGTLGWADSFGEGTYTGGTAVPSRIAIYSGLVGADLGSRTIAFWASEADGSVHAMDLPGGAVRTMWPARAHSDRMDISADSSGVCWSDWTDGTVVEWRAWADDVVVVSRGGQPTSVLGVNDAVFWADSNGAIYWVPR